MARPLRKHVAVALLFLVANLVLLEVGARVWLGDRAHLDGLTTGVDDSFWRLAWILRRKANEASIYPIDVFHPTRGWAVKPNMREQRVGEWVVSTNSLGARGTREFTIPKPPGTFRILVFGDSNVFGEEVGDDETLVALLARALPEVEVINLGVHGYGHDQMLLYLQESLAAYQADVAILGYVYVDDLRNLLGFRDFAKPRYSLRDGQLVLEGAPVPSPDELIAAEPFRPKLFDLADILYRNARWRSGALQDEMHAVTDAIVVEFAASARRLGATPVVAYMPVQRELVYDDPEPIGPEQHMMELCRTHDIPFAWLRPRFLAARRKGVRSDAALAHWTTVEHAVAAQALATYLRKSGIVPAPASPARTN